MTVRYNDAVPRGREVMDLTSRMMHLYYCEGNVEGSSRILMRGSFGLGPGNRNAPREPIL